MKGTMLRTGQLTLLAAVVALLGLGAAAAPHSSAAGKPAHGPVVTVKTARQARGVVFLEHARVLLEAHDRALAECAEARQRLTMPVHRAATRHMSGFESINCPFGGIRLALAAAARINRYAVERVKGAASHDTTLPEKPRSIVDLATTGIKRLLQWPTSPPFRRR